MKRKLFALVSNQGTGADETCLCETCRTPANEAMARAEGLADTRGNNVWHDVSENGCMRCIVCGYEAAV